MITIQSLQATGINDLYDAFNDAYEDYEVHWSKSAFEAMILRRGYKPQLSFGAFDNNRLISFILNGIGHYNGIKTAYDTGTGTLKTYRKQGLSTRVFQESLPFLTEVGIQQYILEVLQYNTDAISVYKNAAISISRELNYFALPIKELRQNTKQLPLGYIIKSISLEHQQTMPEMWDFIPSWQNSFEAVTRVESTLKMLGIFSDTTLAGYGITDPSSGDIAQIAVHPRHRRKGIGSVILKELIKYNTFGSVKLINAEKDCYSFNKFMASQNIPLRGNQFEMIKHLQK